MSDGEIPGYRLMTPIEAVAADIKLGQHELFQLLARFGQVIGKHEGNPLKYMNLSGANQPWFNADMEKNDEIGQSAGLAGSYGSLRFKIGLFIANEGLGMADDDSAAAQVSLQIGESDGPHANIDSRFWDPMLNPTGALAIGFIDINKNGVVELDFSYGAHYGPNPDANKEMNDIIHQFGIRTAEFGRWGYDVASLNDLQRTLEAISADEHPIFSN